ncbi:MAG: MMPL family transporter, partial [Acidimicrobiia bacterium]|nr:MMPL family transporter [Acidimicrobiia bacterium]
PWVALVAGAAVLLVLASPVLGLNMGFSDEGNFPEDTTTRKAYDLIAEGFGPGFNGPFLVTAVPTSADGPASLEGLQRAIADTEGVATASAPIPDNVQDPAAAEAFLIQVIPTTSPQDEATEDLVKHLREDVIPASSVGLDVNVTGAVPSGIDFTTFLGARILLFFGVVLALSFLLLMAVFRSVVVPLKAVIMNVLSIAASYGVVVVIFQWGWGGQFLNIAGAPIEPFIPMMLFAIVFGLSMDYEVFLLSRVKEEYERTGDARNSVADGLASTARVISAAAAIMIVVFGSFMFESNRIIKLFGLGLSLAVLLDASLVRLLLVPATMELLGARTGGCLAGSTGSCPTSTSRAPRPPATPPPRTAPANRSRCSTEGPLWGPRVSLGRNIRGPRWGPRVSLGRNVRGPRWGTAPLRVARSFAGAKHPGTPGIGSSCAAASTGKQGLDLGSRAALPPVRVRRQHRGPGRPGGQDPHQRRRLAGRA